MVCDLAEQYGILNIEGLPVNTLATLVYGLGEDSRIKRNISGVNASLNTLLLACIVDRLGVLIWQKTKDGQKGRNRPKSFVESLVKKDNDVESFDSVAEFEKALKRFN